MYNFLVNNFSFILTSFSLFFIGNIVLLLSYLNSKRSFWTKQGLKTENIFVSFLHNFSLIFNGERLRRQQGKIFGFYRGLSLILNCGDADVLRFILSKDFHTFTNRRKIEFGDEITKNFMFFLEDDNWRRVRSIVTPTFTLSRLKKVKPLVDDCVNEMINNLNDFIENKNYGKNTTKTAVNVCQAIEAYSMHVVIQMGYGARVHSIIETNNPVVYSAKEFFSNISRLFTWSFIISEKYLYSVINEHNLSFLKTLALRITSERKKKCARNEEAKRNDFLQLMLDALEKDSSSNSSDDISNFNVCRRDISDCNSSNSEGDFSENKQDKKCSYDFKTNKTLTSDEFVSQSVLFLIAGFDTIVTLLSCALYNLASNQDKQKLLFEEVKQAMNDTQEIEIEKLNSLKYLDSVICETLRLFPPIPFIDRRASQDYVIEKHNLKVPKGTLVHIPIHSIHRDPDYFPDPEQFKPERFFPENRNFHPYAFIPFGAGPRSCIGIRWALLKSKLALFHLIYNFEFSLIHENLSPPTFNGSTIILSPKIEWLYMVKR